MRGRCCAEGSRSRDQNADLRAKPANGHVVAATLTLRVQSCWGSDKGTWKDLEDLDLEGLHAGSGICTETPSHGDLMAQEHPSMDAVLDAFEVFYKH